MTRSRLKKLRGRGQTGLLRCVSILLTTELSALLMSRGSRRGLMQQCRRRGLMQQCHITYIATREGWLYVASVLDVGSRRLIGYSMADHMRTELVVDALKMAVAARGGDKAVAGVIAHADRGSQYTSNDYIDYCQDAARQMRPSVGRTGVCWDNAVAESFWESLKRECVQGRVFATRAEARRAIFKWINWYNTTRLHSSLDHVAPIEWEQQYRQVS